MVVKPSSSGQQHASQISYSSSISSRNAFVKNTIANFCGSSITCALIQVPANFFIVHCLPIMALILCPIARSSSYSTHNISLMHHSFTNSVICYIPYHVFTQPFTIHKLRQLYHKFIQHFLAHVHVHKSRLLPRLQAPILSAQTTRFPSRRQTQSTTKDMRAARAFPTTPQ